MSLDGEYEPGTWDWVAKQVAQYEASGGTEANTINGYPVIVLTHLGAKSGKVRKTPVIKIAEGDRYAAVASKGGDPENPSWFHNLVTHPEVRVQDGAEVRTYNARLVEGTERLEWWDRAVAGFPQYAEYQKNTERVIPVFVLEPAS